MKLLKLIFAAALASLIMLITYFFVWNYMAKNRLEEIVTAVKSTKTFNISYKEPIIKGYPDDINIEFNKVVINSNDSKYNLTYRLGDILFNIYPFVLEQQAKIFFPKEHVFSLTLLDEEKSFKLKTSEINIRFVDDTIGVDLSNVELFDLAKDEKILHIDKIYYTAYANNKNRFKINFKNMLIQNRIIDSTQVSLELTNISQLDVIVSLLAYAVLDKPEFNKYFAKLISSIDKTNTVFNIENMKWVDNNKWFELGTILKLDSRNRLSGPLDIVSNSIKTSEYLLKVLTSNYNFDLSSVDSVNKLQKRNSDRLIRINGNLDVGSLKIFNEQVSRIKPLAR